MRLQIIFISLIIFAVSCNEVQQTVQTSQNSNDFVIGFGDGQTPPPSDNNIIDITENPLPETDGDETTGLGEVNPPVVTPTVIEDGQQINFEGIDLNTVVYSQSVADFPPNCSSENFNNLANILFRNASPVVVGNTLEFLKAYQSEAIMILANDIDLTGVTALPAASSPQLLIYGNHHTIKNYQSDRTLFFNTSTAFFCHLNIDQVKVHTTPEKVDTWFGGLLRRSRLGFYDVSMTNFDINIPDTVETIVLAGAVAASCINNSIEKVVMNNIKLKNRSHNVLRLAGLCGDVGLNFGTFEGAWDSEFRNIQVDSTQGSVGIMYGTITGRESLGGSTGKNAIRGINIAFENNSVIGAGSGGEFAGATAGPVDIQNVQSKNFKLDVHTPDSIAGGAGGLVGEVRTAFTGNNVELDQVKYEQLDIKHQGKIIYTGGLVGECRSDNVTINNSFVSGKAVIQSTSTVKRSGKISACSSTRQEINNQSAGFSIQ